MSGEELPVPSFGVPTKNYGPSSFSYFVPTFPNEDNLSPVYDDLEAELGALVVGVYTSTSGLLERAERLATAAGARGSRRYLALAELVQAGIYSRTNQNQDGMRMAQSWLRLADDRLVAAQAHAVIGAGLSRLGNRTDSVAHVDQAMRLLNDGDPLYLRADHALAFAAVINGYRDGGFSVEAFELAHRLAEELGDPGMIVANLNNWAWVTYEQGDCEGATAIVERILKISERSGFQPTASCIDTIARIRLESGDAATASAIVHQVLAGGVAEVEGDAVPGCLLTLAEIKKSCGDLEGAVEHLVQCRDMSVRYQLAETGARALRELAACHAVLGDFQQAYGELAAFHTEWTRLHSRASAAAATVMQASFGVEDARRRLREYQELAERDPLTGLWNRRKWDFHCATPLFGATASGTPASVAVLDLDHFKLVNDDHSHTVGDEVLRVVARILAEEAGETGRAVRLGGEEFLLVLPLAGRLALECCERIRHRIARYRWQSLAPGLNVTVSIGVSDVRPTDDQRSVFHRADRHLYMAKRRGRDGVIGDRGGESEDALGGER
ncbi:MAG: GGDEF domain-containing protein [Dactylosporangium sp.]|nr:GGDEF domain-containing protein [Dactylosporangium sp.]NNJ59749.1 GGDEF domain-containing protein [Dactylosporangium sp.]